MKDLEKIITSFGVQEELNPKIWDNSDDAPKSHMKLEVKNQLDEIAEEFIKFVNVDKELPNNLSSVNKFKNFNCFSNNIHLLISNI